MLVSLPLTVAQGSLLLSKEQCACWPTEQRIVASDCLRNVLSSKIGKRQEHEALWITAPIISPWHCSPKARSEKRQSEVSKWDEATAQVAATGLSHDQDEHFPAARGSFLGTAPKDGRATSANNAQGGLLSQAKRLHLFRTVAGEPGSLRA